MPALTRVCTWKNAEWIQITAQEAAISYPQGVAAEEHIFWCELCGQYVLLTRKGRNEQHFRHSSGEENKTCEERVARTNILVQYQKSTCELPLFIRDADKESFFFELCFPRLPDTLLTQLRRVRIDPETRESKHFLYSAERFFDGACSLFVGDEPCKVYHIKVDSDTDMSEYWPVATDGVRPEGTLFDGVSGRRLSPDADVEIRHKYYLLCAKKILQKIPRLILRQCAIKKKSYRVEWYLYEVCAEDASRESAEFFIRLGYRLTNHPIKMQIIWPLCIVQDMTVKQKYPYLWAYVRGNVSNHTPLEETESFVCGDNSKCMVVACPAVHRRISVGRARMLTYFDVWRDPLENAATAPLLRVRDICDQDVEEGVFERLPRERMLRIYSVYDGYILLYRKEELIQRVDFKADLEVELNELSYAMELRVIVGRDVAWQGKFRTPSVLTNEGEMDFLADLQQLRGHTIKAPYTLRTIARRLNSYPAIRAWVCQCSQRNVISERAYKKLRYFVMSNSDFKEIAEV